MICNELISQRELRNNANGREIDLNKYGRLPGEGRKLIRDRFRLACDRLTSDKNNCFETFMFAWIAFNGWAACISGIDTDRKMLRALMQDESICTKFRELYHSDANLNSYATGFSQLWPIFEVKSVRHVQYEHDADRGEIIKHYLAQHASVYSPPCRERHAREGNQTPIDWPHTLDALYRVRCNLFHGEKALSSENDRRIVSYALYTLVYFLQGSHYLE